MVAGPIDNIRLSDALRFIPDNPLTYTKHQNPNAINPKQSNAQLQHA